MSFNDMIICKISSISVFRNILQKKPMRLFVNLLKCNGEIYEKLNIYSEFVNSLGKYKNSFSDFLWDAVSTDENAYVKGIANNAVLPISVEENAMAELDILSDLTKLSVGDLTDFDYEGYIPWFENTDSDFKAMYLKRIKNISKYGYGIFSNVCMFKLKDDKIIPVETADTVNVEQFVGYEQQRNQVMENTRMLVEGRPALNTLLCGDAGTGKSSTVKAAANYFYDSGVRLIEIRKDQLFQLPYVMEKIEGNPLKFIIFIDDLSFNKNDDSFSMLKAVLEGSASARADNAVIYATSNRRHIIKETFADRSADDVHRNDTMQELLSLSERFGLTVYFERPNKKLYLDIVHQLAVRNNIEVDDRLDIKAEAYALGRGTRSPRAAEHFIKSLL